MFTLCSIFHFVSNMELLYTQIEVTRNVLDALNKIYRLCTTDDHLLWDEISHSSSFLNPT